MYKYSQNAELRFLSIAELCFLFAWFAQNPAALAQTRKKIEAKEPDYIGRIFKDIEEIRI